MKVQGLMLGKIFGHETIQERTWLAESCITEDSFAHPFESTVLCKDS